jgi:hypothetical protein
MSIELTALYLKSQEWKLFSLKKGIPLNELEEKLLAEFSRALRLKNNELTLAKSREIAGKIISRHIEGVMDYAKAFDIKDAISLVS